MYRRRTDLYQTLDAENRLISVTVSGQTTQFIYDGDGNLVKKIKPDGSKTLYVGGIYEVDKTSGGSVTRTITHYPVAGAMKINSTLYYILKDHLGSASVVTDASGVTAGEQRYYPYGETRLTTGTICTDKLFTSQHEMAGLGIYHYQARFYSPKIGRFLSADTITPNPANPQNFNRYSYVTNNPLLYIDPTGHDADYFCSGSDDYSSSCTGYVHDQVVLGSGGGGDDPIDDPNWGQNDNREERTEIVWNAVCQSGGWWGSGCPSEQQLLSWLLYEEGSSLSYNDQVNMARGMRYRFANFDGFIVQLSAFTAFFNPDGDGDFDQSDWNALTNPHYDLTGTSTIVREVYKSDIKATDGNYVFWWDENERKTPQNRWPGKIGVDYFTTTTVKGLPFYFTGIPNIRSCAMYGTNCR